MGIGTITQINGITSAVQNFFDPNGAAVAFSIGGNSYSWAVVIAGLIVTIFVALVVIGGIQRISKVSEIIVPFMAILYVGCALILVFSNITKIPDAIVMVCKGAFSAEAVVGGGIGITMKMAMQKGIARGIFSNEAGLGSAPIAAAAARTKEPVRQGLVCMTGTFFDTIIICTMTGLSIVLTGAWEPAINGDLVGAAVTVEAFQTGLSFFKQRMCVFAYALSYVLCIHDYSRMGLLFRKMSAIPCR